MDWACSTVIESQISKWRLNINEDEWEREEWLRENSELVKKYK
jgi:hypothetical protein